MRANRLVLLLAALLALAGGAAGPSRAAESTRLVVSCTWPGDPSPATRRATPRRTGIPAAAPIVVAPEFAAVQPTSVRAPRIEHSLFQRPPPDTN